MENTIERIYVKDKYGDVPLGLFLIRGENVVLLGDIVSTLIFSKNISQDSYCLMGMRFIDIVDRSTDDLIFKETEREALVPLKKVSTAEIKAEQKKEQDAKEAQEKLKRKIMMERGMAVDNVDLGE